MCAVQALEDEFDRSIPDQSFRSIESVSDIVSLFEQSVPQLERPDAA